MAVLAIHDFSCYSKSSLTVALPVLEALSVEAAAMPAALLSTQTDGFDDIYIRDLADDMVRISDRFSSLGIAFDGIYSGFLASERQIGIVSSLIDRYDTLTLVDPVMGDNGELYKTVTEGHARAMARLARKADIITPNFTEASIIADIGPLPAKLGQGDIKDLVTVLRSLGPRKGAITSIPLEAGGLGNAAWDGEEIRLFQYDDIGVSYPGSGDLFASILFALSVKGNSFFGSVLHATSIASIAIASAKAKGRERRLGIELAPVMAELRRRAL